jgi:hypothetical protein
LASEKKVKEKKVPDSFMLQLDMSGLLSGLSGQAVWLQSATGFVRRADEFLRWG